MKNSNELRYVCLHICWKGIMIKKTYFGEKNWNKMKKWIIENKISFLHKILPIQQVHGEGIINTLL